ncbi:MAG: hypothetical protein ACRD2A_18270 [Vicinamibacterales bacterium]
MIACSDAAVDSVTAPRPTVTPAAPVADQWPTEEELAAAGMPGAIGIQITSEAHFEDDYKTFVAQARVRFQWVNEVSARLSAALLNQGGAIVNSSTAQMAYKRAAIPVASGDTTFTVRMSTNNVTCGLLGKHSVSGRAELMALNASLITISLYMQEVGETNGPDVPQPPCPPEPPDCDGTIARVIAGATGILASESTDCEDAPAPPAGGGGGDDVIEVCYAVWRELWIWDWRRNTYTLVAEWLVGVFCYSSTQ